MPASSEPQASTTTVFHLVAGIPVGEVTVAILWVLRTLPHHDSRVVGEVSSQHRTVHHFVVRELPRFGRPMPPGHIADGLGLPVATVAGILVDLEARKGFLFRGRDGAVVWAYPVTAEPTPHRIRFKSGETLYAA